MSGHAGWLHRAAKRLAALRDRAALRKAPLFDADWYLSNNPDLGTRIDPALHYLTHGAAEGRDPGPGFSSSGYGLQGWSGRGNPLLHHARHPTRFAALPVFKGTGDPQDSSGATVAMYCAHQAGSATFGAERSFLFMLEQARKTGMAIDAVLPYCLDAGYLSAVRARARAVWLIPYTWRRAGRGPHRVTLAALSHAIRVSGAAELHQNTLVCDAPLLAARRAGIRGFVHIRELPDHDPELCARIGLSGEDLRRDLLEQADEFVANSDTTARWIDPSGRLGARLRIVPNTVEDALFDLQFAPARPVRVGLVSSNVAKKGIADARAVALTCDRLGLPVDMVLIGPATPDLSALYPLPPNMRHAGYAAGPIAVMARLDIVLSLSHFAESFGRSVLEAMAAGRPVIAYDRGHPPTLIGANAGRVVPVDDPDAVARALQDLLVTPGALTVASAAARARARALLANDRRSGIASDAVGRAGPPGQSKA